MLYKVLVLTILIVAVCSIFIYTQIIYKNSRLNNMNIITISKFVDEYSKDFNGYILLLNEHQIENSLDMLSKVRKKLNEIDNYLVASINFKNKKEINFLEVNEIFNIPTILYYNKGRVRENINIEDLKVSKMKQNVI